MVGAAATAELELKKSRDRKAATRAKEVNVIMAEKLSRKIALRERVDLMSE